MTALSTAIAALSPAVYWQFQESSDGSTASDSSGNARDGAKQGTTGGTLGVASPIAAGDSYVWEKTSGDAYWASNSNATDTNLDVGTGDYAYFFVCKISNGTSTYVELVSRDAGATGNGQMILLNTGDGVVRTWCGGTSLNGTIRISDNTIRTIVVTRVSGTLYVYVNGSLDVSTSASGGTNVTNRPLRFAVCDGSYARPTGLFAHFAYFKSGLSSSDAAALHSAAVGATAKADTDTFTFTESAVVTPRVAKTDSDSFTFTESPVDIVHRRFKVDTDRFLATEHSFLNYTPAPPRDISFAGHRTYATFLLSATPTPSTPAPTRTFAITDATTTFDIVLFDPGQDAVTPSGTLTLDIGTPGRTVRSVTLTGPTNNRYTATFTAIPPGVYSARVTVDSGGGVLRSYPTEAITLVVT